MICRILFLMFIAVISGCSTLSGNAERIKEIGPFPGVEANLQQQKIQECLDEAQEHPCTFRFAPGEYLLTDPKGVCIPDGCTLLMTGAHFILDKEMVEDGQAFLLKDVSNITIDGGEIVGARDAWDKGTNIAGIRVTGNVGNLHINNLVCRDLSSNAVGVFGKDDETPIRNVILENVTGINCCNIYVDYMQENKGPVPGSDRKDQGTVAFYHVDGWLVDNCRFEGSRSDGTHFYHSHNGRFVNSSVIGSTMGGYFLEGCENVMAGGNYIHNNGSRGVTIERDSRCCTLTSNIVSHSGREGAWLPDVASIVISNNQFIENGQKDDGERDCEIRMDNGDHYATRTENICITGNIFRTQAHQTAVVFSGEGKNDFLLQDNTFYGDVPQQNMNP